MILMSGMKETSTKYYEVYGQETRLQGAGSRDKGYKDGISRIWLAARTSRKVLLHLVRKKEHGGIPSMNEHEQEQEKEGVAWLSSRT
jgi:hypothetical protein